MEKSAHLQLTYTTINSYSTKEIWQGESSLPHMQRSCKMYHSRTHAAMHRVCDAQNFIKIYANVDSCDSIVQIERSVQNEQ